MLAGKYSKADLVPADMKNLGSRKALNAITAFALDQQILQHPWALTDLFASVD